MTAPRSLLIILLLALPRAAAAQVPVTPLSGESPTQGVRLPAPTVAGVADATAVQINPAGLALLPSWSAVLHHAEISREGRLAGGGDALMFGSPLPLLPYIAAGVGLSWLRPSEATGYADSVQLSFALAARYRDKVGLGASVSTFISDDDPDLDGLATVDLGLWFHPFEWAGAALVVHDLTTPKYGGVPLQRRYDLELSARPLRNDRLEIGVGVRLGERRLELDPRLRLAGEPLAGLSLFAEVEALNRDFNRNGDKDWDFRATVGVGLRWERLGFAVSTTLVRPMDSRGTGPLSNSAATSAYQGVGATVSVQGSRSRPLFNLDRRLLLVDLSKVKGDRALVKLVGLLGEVERRDDMAGLLLKVDDLSMGWSGVQELRRWIKRLTAKGKKTVAYMSAAGVREYYLAAAASHVLLDPAGGIRVQGLSLRSLYFRGLLDRVGASPQFVKIAEFKSAPEQYTRAAASPAARQVRRAIIDDLMGQFTTDLAADRKKTAKQVTEILDRGPFTPPLAMTEGLVDELVPPSELDQALKEVCDCVVVRADTLKRSPDRWKVGDGIAVILLEGDIVSGKSQRVPLLDLNLVGDRTIIAALQWARAEPRVRGVVVRVNSPGGSALASRHMWREVRRLAESKPVVVSMGDMAASGGYYVAAGGARILAQPATITGSIGIFTGKFDLSGLMKTLGVTVDGEARGKRALMDSYTRPYTAEERKAILDRLQYYYRQFLAAVAAGRAGWTQDRVHELARGRVWTGRQALQNGLADAEGGIEDALQEVRSMAGISTDRPLHTFILPRKSMGLLDRALGAIGLKASPVSELIPRQALDLLRKLPGVLLRASSGEPLARMPEELILP